VALEWCRAPKNHALERFLLSDRGRAISDQTWLGRRSIIRAQSLDGFFGADNRHPCRPGAQLDFFAAMCIHSILMCGHHLFGLDSKDQKANAEKSDYGNKESRLSCFDSTYIIFPAWYRTLYL
jgi:hypothetical protein